MEASLSNPEDSGKSIGPTSSHRKDALQELLENPRQRFPATGASRVRSGSFSKGGQTDYDEEARKLWARLNLDPSMLNQGPYNAVDALWRHPKTGGTFFVGNQTAASDIRVLESNQITHVVNCTDNMPLYHERSGRIKYFRFDITSHYRRVHSEDDAIAFVLPMLQFVTTALAEGKNVMAHCLAGAHRAGTTGCLCLMHLARLSRDQAVPIAKRLRPIIDPISDFPVLMDKVERGWHKRGRPELAC